MRWDHLRLTEEGDRPDLPLIERRAVARTFDTPEFRGITFYEIHAKSLINKVPAASRVPFSWTINPYRGCSHSCSYCATGDTPILMADGRTKSLSDVRTGDRIYGTIRKGEYLRYVTTEVLDHWRTVKSAYRLTLQDGTQLITSGDHRFLTDRGWKHVTGTEQGADRRPHLTLNNKLIGTGRFAEPPKDTVEYRRGYLCGMIRGDAYLRLGRHADKAEGVQHRASCFRLALKDDEALQRSRAYLADFDIPTREFLFQRATDSRAQINAISNQTYAHVAKITELIEWPIHRRQPQDWAKGYLAGLFDAEGSWSCGILRICNSDPLILNWLDECLVLFGFSFVAEKARRPATRLVEYRRLTGGLREFLRFFHTVDPAITSKRSIEGRAVKGDAPLRVVSVEPVGLDLPLYDITTGTGDFIANGVISHNCFARKSHEYLDLDSGADFDSKIVVKVNAAELVRRELAAPRWRGEPIAMGTNVDCYQRAEGRYRLMPGIIAALRDAANPFSILTKGSLILRDLPLLAEAAERTTVGAAVSVGSVDRELWRLVEPGTPAPGRRLEVCAALNEAGIGCAVLMGPVIPYLSDSPAQLEATVRQIAQAGATSVSPITLHLRPGAREWFLAWLREHHPELVVPYARLYGGRSYAPRWFQERIAGRVRELAARYGIGRRGAAAGHRPLPRASPVPPVAAGPTQLTLPDN